MAVATELKRASVWGGNGGGGGGGSRGGSRVRRVQTTNTADASSVASQGQEGTSLTKPARISVLTLRVGEKTHNVLRNVALPTLGGSVWCKRWHHGGHCLSGCDSKGSHIPPTAAALAKVTATLKIERAPG